MSSASGLAPKSSHWSSGKIPVLPEIARFIIAMETASEGNRNVKDLPLPIRMKTCMKPFLRSLPRNFPEKAKGKCCTKRAGPAPDRVPEALLPDGSPPVAFMPVDRPKDKHKDRK